MNLEGVEKVFGGGRKVILGGVESEFGGGRFQKFSARFARPRSTPPKLNPVSGPALNRNINTTFWQKLDLPIMKPSDEHNT